MRTKSRRRLTLAAWLCTATALAGVARAQPVTPTQVPSEKLEEVVVTAEKRASTIQKTPISVTVLTGKDLQAAGLTNLVAVAQEVPGVSFKSSGPGQTEFEIRGLTSTGGESPTVGFYLDDTPLTPPAMAKNGKVVIDPNLYDIARVEVLRGPQGTLYGAGSMGGTIKVITNPPDLYRYTGSVETTGSGTDNGGLNHTENVAVNLPIAPGIAALRVVATDKWIDGYIDRIVLNPFPLETNNSTTRGNVGAATVSHVTPDSNWERLQGVRSDLLLQPIEGLSITPGVLYQGITQGGPNTIDNPPGDQLAHYQPYNVAEPFSDSFILYSLDASYDFDDIRVTSATAQWYRHQAQTQDISEAMQDYIGGFFGPSASFPFATAQGGLGAGTITEVDHTRQFSQEVRINSTSQGPWQWLVGAFYSDFDATSHVYSFYPGFTALFGTDNLADNHRQLTLSQTAAFGETSYKFLDVFKATVGLRWFSYNSNSATSVSGVSANGTSQTLLANASNSGFTPKFDLAYQPNPDLTVYATAAKGFRPGGPNSPIPSSCDAALHALGLDAAPTQFAPDSVWSYELGEKARLFGDTVTVNGAVYYEDWSGVQQQVAPACGFKFTANAGDARVFGGELEVVARLTPSLTLSESAAYTNATNTTTVAGAGVTAGQLLLDVPRYTSNTTLAYTQPLADTLSFTARVTSSFVDSMQDITYARNTLPPYDLINLRAGLISPVWTATLFVDNITNRRAFLSDTGALSANISILNRVTVEQPRTIGVDLTYKF
jgi:iron complex outermembrane receptor protein